jgi:multidrug resistance efflux pump
MTTSGHDLDMRHRTSNLLAAGAEAELHLLRSERKAEKRLAKAMASLASDEARLLRAQQRLERSRAAVAAAEATLRGVQAQRAAGPARDQDED